MKHCPNETCSFLLRFGRVSAFLDTIESCRDCGTALVPGEAPPQPVPVPEYRELVTIYRTSSYTDAHLARAALEANEVFVYVAGSAIQGAMGELPPTMLSLRVQVPHDDVVWARGILARLAGTSSEDSANIQISPRGW